MTPTARLHRIAAFAAVGLSLGAFAACSSSAGALGSDCLRDDDCAAGVCFALKCRLPPTNANARASGGANAYVTATPDAGAPPVEDAASPEPISDAAPADAAPADAEPGDAG